jgi:molybdopterin molybdotransferase
MISVDEARQRILAGLRRTPPEMVALSEAWGRVTAAAIVARLTQPPEDVSAMDGYALRQADGGEGNVLRLVGSAPAGHPFGGLVGPGDAVRIFTGSLIPRGADTILLQEDASVGDGLVTVRETTVAGRHIRRRGQDFGAGDEVVAAGRVITARDVGLAAAANHPWVRVHRKPRIAVLATGDEIALPGEPIPAGGIISSNAHALAGLIRATGGEASILPVAADDRRSLAEAATQIRAADMLVTTGGASVGEHDLVQSALGEQGLEVDFWKIAMRPGKPLMHGRIGGIPMLGLPGNPVSSLVCAMLFLIPAIRVLVGLPAAAVPTRPAVLGAALGENDHRADFLRAKLTQDAGGGWIATAFPRQDSAMLWLLAQADALILRAPLAPALEAGARVDIIRLADLGV